MGEKSQQKRKYILERAREVFYAKGYRAVTMKDIVEACGISRGGLYLYFSNVKELFEAVLEEERAGVDALLGDVEDPVFTPGERLLMYLDGQKKGILKKKDNLAAAEYEYMFENSASEKGNLVNKQFDKSVTALERLIEEGVEQEWMACEDAAEAARNILYTLEGLRVLSLVSTVTTETMDREIAYIMGMLGMAVKKH